MDETMPVAGKFQGLRYIVFHSPCVEGITDPGKRSAVFNRTAKVGAWDAAIAFIDEAKRRGLPLTCRDSDHADFVSLKARTIPCIVLTQDDVYDVWCVDGPADLDLALLDPGGALHPDRVLEQLAGLRRRVAAIRATELDATDLMQSVAARLRRQEAIDPRELALVTALSIDASMGVRPRVSAAEMTAAGLTPRQVIVVDGQGGK